MGLAGLGGLVCLIPFPLLFNAMNALLFVLIASLCGLSNALALPVVSRSAQESRSPWQRPSILAERSMKVYGFLADAGNDNVVNFQDTVVSGIQPLRHDSRCRRS